MGTEFALDVTVPTDRKVFIMRRSHISRSGSRKNFSRNAKRVHPKNFTRYDIMRGGYRL